MNVNKRLSSTRLTNLQMLNPDCETIPCHVQPDAIAVHFGDSEGLGVVLPRLLGCVQYPHLKYSDQFLTCYHVQNGYTGARL